MSDPSRDRRLSPLDANAGHAADATLSPPGSLGRTQIITTESQLFESFPEAAAAVATAAGGANSNAGGEFGHVASIRSSPVPSRPHGATGESRTEQTTAVPALELHEMDPTFDYHAEKTIQSEDFRHFAQYWNEAHLADGTGATIAAPGTATSPHPTVFYPGQATGTSKERLIQIQRAASVEYADEFRKVYGAFRECVRLRNKYIRMSLQRTGDNPMDLETTYKPYPVPHSIGQLPAFNYSTTNLYSTSPSPSLPRQDMLQESVEPLRIDMDLIPGKHDFTYRMNDEGVFEVFANEEDAAERRLRFEVPSIKAYYMDLEYVLNVVSDGPNKSFAFRRLRFLESKYQLYSLLNEHQEMAETKRVPHRDFYNVRKVDTHVHHSSCMNQKHLLRFIKGKLKRKPNDVVIFRDGKYLTLQQVFESLNLTAYDLSIDTLDMHAHKDSFHRFDKFNLKYNPIGESRLREIFLKTDNFVRGKYFAELTREVIADLEASKYQMAEYRLSIYGRSPKEWDKIAAWVCDNRLFSDNVRWLIQVPRLYPLYKQSNTVENFEEMLDNIFKPLFEVTQDPKSHPQLHIFLQRVVGFDSVDDESKPERRIHKKYPVPRLWNFDLNPPYAYYLFYMYANIASLNQWRKERGFNTFSLRPHAGEAGDTDNLAASFLTSTHINHGIMLRKVPALQYLYYLEQIGLAMSPLSNNALFVNYERNPLNSFFKLGMNVSLSTDDPLQFHYTKEPLIEEFSVAAQIWKFSAVDMCELARNSVLQSGWEMGIKKKWLGARCFFPGSAGNDIHKTNVPELRIQYRYQTLLEERNLVLHFDEPHIYDYPGWPYVIPVVSTPADNGDANAATDGYAAGQVVMTKQPSLSAQSSATLLPGFAPQQPLFRKQQLVTDAAGKLHVPSPLPGAQILPDQSRDSSMSSLDQGSHRNLHEGTQRDSQSRVDLLALDGDDEVTLDSDDDDNVEIVGHMELDGENASNVDAIARLSRSLKDGAALTDRSDVGQAISRPSTTTPRPIGLDSDEPSELFASIDPKTIESVSKMGTRTSASTTTSSGSMTSMGASATTGGGSATAAMPLISQQSMRVVPGMIAAASRQRTKSAEDTSIQATTSADASAASVLRKEKKKLHMTQM